MSREEKLFNTFLQGKVVFVCNSLISFRSCRKLVRVHAAHIIDNLTEDIFKEETHTTIGIRVERNELQLTPPETKYGYINYASIDFDKELYQQLLNMQTEQNVTKYNGGNDMVTERATLWGEDCCMIPKVVCTASDSCVTEALAAQYASGSEIVTLRDEIDNLKKQFEGDKEMELSDKVNKMLDEYYRTYENKIMKELYNQRYDLQKQDSFAGVITAAQEKIIQMINRMAKNKEISKEEEQEAIDTYKTIFRDMDYERRGRKIYTQETKDKIRELEIDTHTKLYKIKDKISEAKNRCRIVETYNQACEVLTNYDIMDLDGIFIYD